MDFFPNWKTDVTALIMALVNILNGLGVVEISPELATQINAILIALIGYFLGLRIKRSRGG